MKSRYIRIDLIKDLLKGELQQDPNYYEKLSYKHLGMNNAHQEALQAIRSAIHFDSEILTTACIPFVVRHTEGTTYDTYIQLLNI